MSTAERAYDRLVTANPVPDPERYMAAAVDIDAALRDLEEDLMDTKTLDRGVTEHAPVRRRRLRVAAAGFVAVLVIGGALLVALPGDDGDVADGTPISVVETFFERWNAGDVDAAMALIDPEMSGGFGGGPEILRGLIEWTTPFDGRMDTACRSEPADARVTCDWAWATAGTEALGLRGSVGANARTFFVVDGLIRSMGVPGYQAFERPITEFAAEQDPEGYAEACSPDGTSPISAFGFPFNNRCGAFVAAMEPAFVASLDG